MPYITIQPHSRTNPTDEYLVVSYHSWLEMIEGDISFYPVYQAAQSALQAREMAREMNARAHGVEGGASREHH